jgi:RNA:NAD 2'-phosphotransferase (TPT1/KptA family)
MLALRASMIYKLRLLATSNQALHFILQTGIRRMHHHIVISARLLADRALLNLEALHAPVDVGEL